MRFRIRLAALGAALALLTGCAGTPTATPGPTASTQPADPAAPTIQGLTYESTLPLQYARIFQVYRYQGGYSLIRIEDGDDYLVVPEGGEVPEGDFIVLQKPLKNIYLVATAAMSLFCALDGLESIRLSGARQEAWYIDQAAQAMEAGDLLYAGKYSSPDYELLIEEDCDLAIESTMIYHTPEVKEKLEELGIPVFVERSSYEAHPLGRTEWIKLYAVLLGQEDLAQQVFQQQAKILEDLSDFENTEQTVAFFYVTNNGTVSVRKSTDYLATMIELAGGRYIFPDLGDDSSANSAVSMTMEDFYAGAREADYLIYNATIDDPIHTVDELLAKSDLFSGFRAVEQGHVWCTEKYLYQATDVLGGMIGDIHTMLTDTTGQTELTFIHKLS